MESIGTDSSKALTSRSVGALKWGFIGVAVRIGLQLAAQIALARLVGPAGFGIVAAAVAVVFVSGIIVELGLGTALVQARHIGSTEIRIAFTRIMLSSIFIAGAVASSAESIATWYGNPQVSSVLRWMMLVVVVQAFSVVSLNLLRRNLDLKTIQIAQICGYLVGFPIVGVACATLGSGTWSLVAAWISQSVLEATILYLAVRHSVVPMLHWNSTPMTRFGVRIAAANLVNLSNELIENAAIGRAYGTAALGTYSLAANLVRTALNQIMGSLQQVSLSFSARSQEDQRLLRQGYLSFLWLAAIIVIPAFLSVGALAPTLVAGLYGDAWRDTIPLLVPLAFTMPMVCATVVGGSMLWGSGHVERETRVSTATAVVMLLVLTITASVSIVAMAWGVWLVNLLRAALITNAVRRLLCLSLITLVSALRGGFLMGSIIATLVFIADRAIAEVVCSAQLRLFFALSLGALLFMPTFLILLPAMLPPVLMEATTQLKYRLPAWIYVLVQSRVPRH